MGTKYDVILLDVDGTLLDFDMAEKLGMQVVLKEYGFDPQPRLLDLYHRINNEAWSAFERGEVTKERLVCDRFTAFFAELGRKVDGSQVEALYRSQLDSMAILVDGALEICKYLQKRYDLYIVTNGTSSTQYKRLALSGIDACVKDIFVSEDSGSQKPQKEYFNYCFSRIPDARPERMLLVGDSLHSDMKGGNAAGTSTCWYNPDKRPGEDGIRIDYEIRRLLELKEFL